MAILGESLGFCLGFKINVCHGINLQEPCNSSWTVDIVCTSYDRIGPLRVLVQSILNQSDDNWNLHVIHDGPSQAFSELSNDDLFVRNAARLKMECSKKRFNDYGHSLREIGLSSSKGDYVLITNDDNYYVPHMLRAVNHAIARHQPDIVMFDMIHSHEFPGGRLHESYQFFPTHFALNEIDMGCVLVRGALARSVGFGSKRYSADWDYFSACASSPDCKDVKLVKIPKVLFVHN